MYICICTCWILYLVKCRVNVVCELYFSNGSGALGGQSYTKAHYTLFREGSVEHSVGAWMGGREGMVRRRVGGTNEVLYKPTLNFELLSQLWTLSFKATGLSWGTLKRVVLTFYYYTCTCTSMLLWSTYTYIYVLWQGLPDLDSLINYMPIFLTERITTYIYIDSTFHTRVHCELVIITGKV